METVLSSNLANSGRINANKTNFAKDVPKIARYTVRLV